MVPCGHVVTHVEPLKPDRARASMDVISWYIPRDLAAQYSATYDSGPDSFMAKWRALKRSNRLKPDKIPLEAWILLAGPFKKHRAVVGRKPKKKKASSPAHFLEPRCDLPVSYQPSKRDAQVAPVRYTEKIVTDISAECLQKLIRNGYGKAQASDLVKRCKDLKSILYDNRPQAVRRLTLPDEPTKRCTSLIKWEEWVLKKHPPSTS